MRPRLPRFVILAVIVLVAAGCTKLDTDGLEGTLKKQVAAEIGSPVTSVDCPSDVEVETGGTFECTATEGSGTTFTVRVTQTDDEGNVTYELVDAEAGPTPSSSATATP